MSEWREATLGEVALVQSGFAFKSKDWRDSGIPVVKIQNVRSGRVNLAGCSYVTDEVAHSASQFRLSRGDVLVTMSGEIGSVGIVRTDDHLVLNQRVGRIRLRAGAPADLRYLAYVIQQPALKMTMEVVAYGAAQPNISPSLISSLPILLPPIDIQRKVAGTLEALDELIENNRRRIKVLEEMARTIYREWFVHFRYPDHHDATFVESPIGLVPADWNLCRIDEACSFVDGKPISKRERTTSGVVVYGANGPIGSTERPAPFEACTVMGKIGSCGALHRSSGPCWVTNNAFGVLPGRWRSLSYVWLALLEFDFRPLIGGAANPYLPRQNFGHLKVVQPPDGLIDQLHQLVAPMFDNADSLGRLIKTTTSVRDRLLPKLVTGQIDVSSLDLDASVEGSVA